jgi:hypothetical protein
MKELHLIHSPINKRIMKTKFNAILLLTGIIVCLAVLLLPLSLEAQRQGRSGGTRSSGSKPSTNQSKTKTNEVQKPSSGNKSATQPSTGNKSNVSASDKNTSGKTVNNNQNVNVNNNKNANVNNSKNVNVNNSKNVNVNKNTTVVVANPRPYPKPPYAYGGYHYNAYHPYHYHPYTPYHYPAYNPWGAIVVALAATAIIVTVANQQYHYDQGVYYVASNGGYTVVPAPVGATITTLPPGSQTVVINETTNNYYYAGTYYEKQPEGYKVVPPTAGCVVDKLPEGGKEEKIGEVTYVKVGDVYYQPITKDGKNMYEVADVKKD